MRQASFAQFTCVSIDASNLLEARMIITSYNQHVRLLSSEPFGWFAPPKFTRSWEPTLFMESLRSKPFNQALRAGETTENIQPIGGRIRSQKVRNCILRAPWTAKELHWPFGDALLFNVTVLTRIIFRYVLKLPNDGEGCFGAFSALGKRKRLRVG